MPYKTPKPYEKRGIALVRLLQMADHLTRERASLYDLAREFEICIRTARRDLYLLERTGLFDIRRRRDEDTNGQPIRYWIPSIARGYKAKK